MKEKMMQGGFDESKLKVLSHFIDIDKCKKESYVERADYYCYVGRLSHEKGLNTLIQAASQLPYKLKIIGGGPLEKELKAKSAELKGNIDFLGFKQWDEIKEVVGKARFSVTPSEWYEVFGLVNAEALCLGTPILGARIGGVPGLIDEGVNGMTFTSGDASDLKEKIELMYNAKFDNEGIARKAMERYSAETYYKEIIKVYGK